MRHTHSFLSLCLLLLLPGTLLMAQPVVDAGNTDEVMEEVKEVEPIDFQQAVVGQWMETWTIVGTDTSSVVNLEGKETYWSFKPDGSFTTAARWAFTKDPLMTFGEYRFSFDGNKLIWDGEESGWEILEVREDMIIMPARFIGDKEGTSVWKKVDEVVVNK